MKKRMLAGILALVMLIGLLPVTALADDAAAKEQIYWAVVDTNSSNKAYKLIISSAEQTEACVAKGSFDYDAVFETRNDVPWSSYEAKPGIATAVVEASNGEMVAPVSTRSWFDHTSIPSDRQKLVSVDLSGLSGERLENMSKMFLQAHQLSTISFPADFDTSHVTDMSEMFSWTGALTSVTGLANWNTSNVTTMESMFNRAEKLATIDDVANWDTSSVTNMKWLFNRCSSLKSVDVSKWDTSKVTNMQQLFNRCFLLTEIDVSKWDTSNVTDMQMVFKSCRNVKMLDLSGWDTSKVTTMMEMFNMEGDSLLEEIKGLENFDLSNVKNVDRMFKNCVKLKSIALDTSRLPEDAKKDGLDTMPNANVVRIIENGGHYMDGTAIDNGKLDTPIKDGYVFAGWYTDEELTEAVAKEPDGTYLAVPGTYYAKWEEATDADYLLPILSLNKPTPKLNTRDHFAYVQGYPDGTVKPAGSITRAEVAAILFRLMDADSRSLYYSTASGFRDVDSTKWYNTYVATLNNAGVITDSRTGYFRPNDAITRAELAAMLAQFAEKKSAAIYFSDVSAGYWAANAIALTANLGWINGYPDGTFGPDKTVTRAELMAMVNRATGRAPESTGALLSGMKTWKDNADTARWYYLDVQEATNSHTYTGAPTETWTSLTTTPDWSQYE